MTTLLPPVMPVEPSPPPPPPRPRWVLALVLAVVGLLLLAGTAVVLLTRGGGDDVVSTTEPAATPSAPVGPTRAQAPGSTPAAPVPAPVDCGVVPPVTAFTAGTTDPCFSVLGERFLVWLGDNTASAIPGGYVPSDTFSAADTENVTRVQRLMGDPPDGWLGQSEWTRLMTQGPPPLTELRTNGIGPLWFGMTAAQIEASGVAVVQYPADERPWVDLQGVEAFGCFDADEFYAVTVKGASGVRTVEGISTASTPADLVAVFGDRLVTRAAPGLPTGVDYVVYDGDYGYAFFVQEDGSLMILAGTRAEVDASGGGPHGLCGA